LKNTFAHVGETIAMDEATQRATEILARHCEYMGYPESGQHMIKTHNALEAVKEALNARPEDKVEALRRIAERVIELEAPAEHLPEPMSSTLLTLADDARAAMGHTPPSGEDGDALQGIGGRDAEEAAHSRSS
jgi:hypothetical protein